MTTNAIILCAGRGRRLGALTDEQPKPLVQVNGVSMLDNAVQNLIKTGYRRVTVVVGYQAQKIKEALKGYRCQIDIHLINNPQWETTNNIFSLYLARNELQGDTTLLEGDIFFDVSVLKSLNDQPAWSNVGAVSELTVMMEGAFVTAAENGQVEGFFSTKAGDHHAVPRPLKTVNLYRLSADYCFFLQKQLMDKIRAGQTDIYYEHLFQDALNNSYTFQTVEVPATKWIEIDNAFDLALGEYQFSDNQHDQLKRQHGGYWRYPITDFSLIYNLHFPPRELKEKIYQRFDQIMLNYPANQRLFIGHIAHFLGVDSNHLVIGNGVSEFIKALPRVIPGRVINVEPSFNEYAACFNEANVIPFRLTEENNFNLDVNALLEVVHQEKPKAVIIITPNNPTGRLVSKEEIVKFYRGTETLGTLLIVDESFLDFSDQRDTSSFLGNLKEYPRIVVFRSMSKTFGIGGLRLGYGATANFEFLNALRNEMPIWNINGFAEEFLLNLPQYRNEYVQSCKKIRCDTDALVEGLRMLDELFVYDTDSNFIMCKIKNRNFTSNQISRRLLDKHNIYIKECSGKDMKDATYFFRLSCRTSEENQRLIAAMRDVFEECNATAAVELQLANLYGV